RLGPARRRADHQPQFRQERPAQFHHLARRPFGDHHARRTDRQRTSARNPVRPGGSISNYDFGQVFGSTMIGGDGAHQNENLLALLGTPVRDFNALASAKYDVSDQVQLFAEASGGNSVVGGASQEARDRGNLVIKRDNAFLPQAVKDLMAADNLQTITIGRVSNDTGKIRLNRNDTTVEAVGGVTATFGGWTADAYAQYGQNNYDLKFGPNNRKQNEFFQAVDAVVD